VIQVVRELQKAGHQVILLAKLNEHLWRSEDLENYYPVSVHLLDKGIFRLFESAIRRLQHDLKLPYANFFESLRFAFACRQELPDCDIYFERMGWMGYGGGLAAKWQNIPLVLEINGDHLDEFESQGLQISPGQLRLSKWIVKKASRTIQFAVATGEGWKQKYIDRWDVDPAKVRVVENGSTLVDMLQRETLKTFAVKSTPEDPVRIAYCGGFEPWHGIMVLLAAIRKAAEMGNNLQVTLIGSGSMETEIEQTIREFQLDSVFTLTGQLSLEGLSQQLAQSEIGVSPYCGRVEFSGLKLLDYKAAGLATIASGANRQPAVLEHGKTGWIVPPCDEDALAQAIDLLAKNQKLRKSIGKAARREAEAIHSWQHTAAQLIQIFELARVEKDSSRFHD
jgi:glycosyltransferase involved in cell wall biosynthesis